MQAGEPKSRGEAVMCEGITGAQGPTKGVWTSRPREGASICQVGPLPWMARGNDGQMKGRRQTLGGLQMKSSLASPSIHFPTPFFCLDIWRGTTSSSGFCFVSNSFSFSLTDNYPFTSFCIRAYCLASLFNFVFGIYYVWERNSLPF